MSDPLAVYLTGTAGVGKTSFTRAFAQWLTEAGYDAVTVNLDPGMEKPAYDPDLDIRDWVKLSEVQSELGLGPNGAQVAASDLMALKVFEVRRELEKLGGDYLLVDTPGQVELFAFRESSRHLVEVLTGERSLIAFLLDPLLARRPGGYLSLLMLSATVQFRFGLPMVNLVGKEDLLSPEERALLAQWGEEPFTLYEAARDESPEGSQGLSLELFRALETIGPLWNPVFTSAELGTGLEDLYNLCQQVFASGEDVERSGGPTSGADEPPGSGPE